MNLNKFMSEDQKTLEINIKLKAKKVNTDRCSGCYFFPNPNGCDERICCASYRNDNKNIIWIEDK